MPKHHSSTIECQLKLTKRKGRPESFFSIFWRKKGAVFFQSRSVDQSCISQLHSSDAFVGREQEKEKEIPKRSETQIDQNKDIMLLKVKTIERKNAFCNVKNEKI